MICNNVLISDDFINDFSGLLSIAWHCIYRTDTKSVEKVTDIVINWEVKEHCGLVTSVFSLC